MRISLLVVVSIACLAGAGCGGGGDGPHVDALVGPLSSTTASTYTVQGRGFFGKRAIVRFRAPGGAPFLGGTTDVIETEAVVESASRITGLCPPAGVTGIVGAFVEVELLLGASGRSRDPVAQFIGAKLSNIVPQTFSDTEPTPFTIHGEGFGPVGASAFLVLGAIEGAPFAGGTLSEVKIPVTIVSETEITGVMPPLDSLTDPAPGALVQPLVAAPRTPATRALTLPGLDEEVIVVLSVEFESGGQSVPEDYPPPTITVPYVPPPPPPPAAPFTHTLRIHSAVESFEGAALTELAIATYAIHIPGGKGEPRVEVTAAPTDLAALSALVDGDPVDVEIVSQPDYATVRFRLPGARLAAVDEGKHDGGFSFDVDQVEVWIESRWSGGVETGNWPQGGSTFGGFEPWTSVSPPFLQFDDLHHAENDGLEPLEVRLELRRDAASPSEFFRDPGGISGKPGARFHASGLAQTGLATLVNVAALEQEIGRVEVRAGNHKGTFIERDHWRGRARQIDGLDIAAGPTADVVWALSCDLHELEVEVFDPYGAGPQYRGGAFEWTEADGTASGFGRPTANQEEKGGVYGGVFGEKTEFEFLVETLRWSIEREVERPGDGAPLAPGRAAPGLMVLGVRPGEALATLMGNVMQFVPGPLPVPGDTSEIVFQVVVAGGLRAKTLRLKVREPILASTTVRLSPDLAQRDVTVELGCRRVELAAFHFNGPNGIDGGVVLAELDFEHDEASGPLEPSFRESSETVPGTTAGPYWRRTSGDIPLLAFELVIDRETSDPLQVGRSYRPPASVSARLVGGDPMPLPYFAASLFSPKPQTEIELAHAVLPPGEEPTPSDTFELDLRDVTLASLELEVDEIARVTWATTHVPEVLQVKSFVLPDPNPQPAAADVELDLANETVDASFRTPLLFPRTGLVAEFDDHVEVEAKAFSWSASGEPDRIPEPGLLVLELDTALPVPWAIDQLGAGRFDGIKVTADWFEGPDRSGHLELSFGTLQVGSVRALFTAAIPPSVEIRALPSFVFIDRIDSDTGSVPESRWLLWAVPSGDVLLTGDAPKSKLDRPLNAGAPSFCELDHPNGTAPLLDLSFALTAGPPGPPIDRLDLRSASTPHMLHLLHTALAGSEERFTARHFDGQAETELEFVPDCFERTYRIDGSNAPYAPYGAVIEESLHLRRPAAPDAACLDAWRIRRTVRDADGNVTRTENIDPSDG